MGRKMDALLGRNFKTSKFKTLTKLALSRIAILKNQRQSKHHHASSDVVELLKLGHQELALLRVEHVIKDRNMMRVFLMIEDYCHLVSKSAALLEKHKECPYELQEAVSSLIYASSRCGEFPELLELRAIFVSRFGKESVSRAVELQNNSGVNPKIVQNLSARQPSLEIRMKVLKEIASKNGIILQMEEESHTLAKGPQQVIHNRQEYNSMMDNQEPQEIQHSLPKERNFEESVSESFKLRIKYTDIAAAALDAFESAAYAAEAARAAVELSRSESQDDQGGGGGGSSHRRAAISDSRGRYEDLEKIDTLNVRALYDEIYPTTHVHSEPEGEDLAGIWSRIGGKEEERSQKKPEIQRISSISSADSEMNLPNDETLEHSLHRANIARQDDTKPCNIWEVTEHDRNYYAKPTVHTNEYFTRYSAAPEEDWLYSNTKKVFPLHSPIRNVEKSRDVGAGDPVYDEKANYAADFENQETSKLHTKPISMRTRRLRGN